MPETTSLSRYLHSAQRLVSGIIRSVYQPSRYGIMRGYLHRSQVVPHDDRNFKDAYQKEVYEKAALLMQQNQWQSVIDVGCGSGYKLIHSMGRYKTTGIDLDPVITQAQADYPTHAWLHADGAEPSQLSADLILCADVIEHVEDPDAFLNWVLSIQNWKCLLISTPERNLKRGKYHFGPSPNPSHFREWSEKELYKFISKYHPVDSHEIINRIQGTQLIICRDGE